MARSAIDERLAQGSREGADGRADSLIRPATHRLVLLTGQSVPANAILSASQIAFLQAVAPSDVDILQHGFPYRRSRESGGPSAPWIAVAAARNAHQYLAARHSWRFREEIVACVDELFAKTDKALLILTGSCGLRLLAAAWPHLKHAGGSCHVVALGPAHLGPSGIPGTRLTTIRGRRDGWSAMLYRGAIDHHVPCGHLDYWTCDTTIAVTRALVASHVARLSGP